MDIKKFINKKGYYIDVMDVIEWLETFGNRDGWIFVLPFFLCAGALLFPKLMKPGLLGRVLSVMSGALIGGLPAWGMIGIFRTGLEVIRAIRIDRDRHKVVAALPEKDRTRVNIHNRLRYVSHDNILDKLYDKPNWKGELRIPDGIEYIGEHAFDCLVAPTTNGKPSRFKMFVKALLIPDSIKKMDPFIIPTGTTVVFDNATHKMMCHELMKDFEHRNINIKGGLFSDVLDVCDGINRNKELLQIPGLHKDTVERIKKAFASLDDTLIKIYLMDKVHEQILKGNLHPSGFNVILEHVQMEDKDRYCGQGVIERIYGSRKNAVDKYAFSYYTTENILNRQNDRKWAKTHAEEPMITFKRLDEFVKFVEDVADDPDRFRQIHMEELNLLALNTASCPHGFNPAETDVAGEYTAAYYFTPFPLS